MNYLFILPCFLYFRLSPMLKQIVPMQYNPRDENSIKAVMAKANVVLNLIGINVLLSVPKMLLNFRWCKVLFWFFALKKSVNYLIIIFIFYSVLGREYETRNYSFEEVNHYMSDQLAKVGYCTHFL